MAGAPAEAIWSLPTRKDLAMDIEYFDRKAPSRDVVAALRRDGAAVVQNQVGR